MRKPIWMVAAVLLSSAAFVQDENDDDRALADCLRAVWAKRVVCDRVDDSLNCLVQPEARLTKLINECVETHPSMNPEATNRETASF